MKTLNFKKFVLAVILLILMIPSSGVAQAGVLKDAINEALSKEENFGKLQSTVIGLIDAAIAKIDSVESKILQNEKLSSSVKTSVQNTLEKIKTALTNYKTAVSQADSVEDLQALNKEIAQFLIDNKDAIKEAIRDAIQDIGEKAQAKVEELKKKLEALIKTLEVLCPDQKDTLESLREQLVQLESELASLKSAVKAKDANAIKKELADLSALSQQIAANVKSVQASCLK